MRAGLEGTLSLDGERQRFVMLDRHGIRIELVRDGWCVSYELSCDGEEPRRIPNRAAVAILNAFDVDQMHPYREVTA